MTRLTLTLPILPSRNISKIGSSERGRSLGGLYLRFPCPIMPWRIFWNTQKSLKIPQIVLISTYYSNLPTVAWCLWGELLQDETTTRQLQPQTQTHTPMYSPVSFQRPSTSRFGYDSGMQDGWLNANGTCTMLYCELTWCLRC